MLTVHNCNYNTTMLFMDIAFAFFEILKNPIQNFKKSENNVSIVEFERSTDTHKRYNNIYVIRET